MATSSKSKTSAQPPGPKAGVLWVIRLLVLCAAVVAGYLGWTSLSGSTVAGCGPESDCAQVLNSRWAYWFGVPVSLIALLVYAAIFTGTWRVQDFRPAPQRRVAWLWLIACAIGTLTAAGWFFSVQWFVIKSFCPYCLVAHGLGSIAALLILLNYPRRQLETKRPPRDETLALPTESVLRATLLSLGAVSVLVAGQIIYQPKTHAALPTANLSSTNPATPTIQPGSTPSIAKVAPSNTAPRLWPIYKGAFQLDLNQVPLAGSPQAPHVLVSLFDYTCHHCREMHPLLAEVQKNLSNKVAVVNLPMPLDSECNPTVKRTHPKQTNACQYARIGLAVWRANQEMFDDYNHWFFGPEEPLPVETARAKAIELVGASNFEQALQDPWIDQQVKTDVAIYDVAYRAGHGRMPQLIIGTNIYFGTMSRDDLSRFVVQQLWGQ